MTEPLRLQGAPGSPYNRNIAYQLSLPDATAEVDAILGPSGCMALFA